MFKGLIPHFTKISQLVSNLKRWGDMRMSPFTRALTYTHTHTHTHKYIYINHDIPIGTRRRKWTKNKQLFPFRRIKFFMRREACLSSKEIHIQRILQITLSIVLIRWLSLHWNSDSFSKGSQIGRAVECRRPIASTISFYTNNIYHDVIQKHFYSVFKYVVRRFSSQRYFIRNIKRECVYRMKNAEEIKERSK